MVERGKGRTLSAMLHVLLTKVTDNARVTALSKPRAIPDLQGLALFGGVKHRVSVKAHDRKTRLLLSPCQQLFHSAKGDIRQLGS